MNTCTWIGSLKRKSEINLSCVLGIKWKRFVLSELTILAIKLIRISISLRLKRGEGFFVVNWQWYIMVFLLSLCVVERPHLIAPLPPPLHDCPFYWERFDLKKKLTTLIWKNTLLKPVAIISKRWLNLLLQEDGMDVSFDANLFNPNSKSINDTF